MQALFRKYVEGRASAGSIDVDGVESALETQAREWGRQRDFSERRLAAWKHKSTLVDDKARYLNNRRVAENSALIVECNELRMANKELKTRIGKLASQLKESQYETLAAKREAGSAPRPGASGASGRGAGRGGRPTTASSDASCAPSALLLPDQSQARSSPLYRLSCFACRSGTGGRGRLAASHPQPLPDRRPARLQTSLRISRAPLLRLRASTPSWSEPHPSEPSHLFSVR